MSGLSDTTRQEAIVWAVQAQDEDFDDWNGLENWLAADPRHADLYDAATTAADEAVRAMSQTPPPAVPRTRRLVPPPRRAKWLPFALAASLVAGIGGTGIWLRTATPAPYQLATLAGDRRSMTLDGSAMTLDGDTHILLDRKSPRAVRLERGQVLFTVKHDPDHPFQVSAGDIVITDVGTVFNVERARDATIIGVVEGAVHVVTPAGDCDLTAGQILSVSGPDARAMRRSEDPAMIGAWPSGRFDFNDVTVMVLAERLHRATGARIDVSPEIQSQHVSGSLPADHDMAVTFRALGPILGISIKRRGNVWFWSGHALASPA